MKKIRLMNWDLPGPNWKNRKLKSIEFKYFPIKPIIKKKRERISNLIKLYFKILKNSFVIVLSSKTSV